MKKGVPDLFLPVPSGKYHGLFIEMKTDTALDEQIRKIYRMNETGFVDEMIFIRNGTILKIVKRA